MSFTEDRRRPPALNFSSSRSVSSRSSSAGSSLKAPRTPRFAEATTVHSPVENTGPFADDHERGLFSQAEPADVGFGYIGNEPSNRESTAVPVTPGTQLKSAMKVPGTARRFDNPMSPTFRQEDLLEKREKATDKQQARDLKIKTRVRLAKFALRGVNFSCSMIVLAMLSSSFAIFNATKNLPALNGLPAWAEGTGSSSWPQKVVLAAACLNLTICVAVFVGYCRGGHHRAEKVGVYYTLFAVGWGIFTMIMWAACAGIIQFSRNNGNDKDMWGWACKDTERRTLFQDKVDYELVCRLQNWALVCIIIEVVVEVISISLYSVIFYRYYTKRRLTKSMDMRDRARSDLYLAQLRTQSAPNTPGFGPKSPAYSQYAMSPRFPPSAYKSLSDVSAEPVPSLTSGAALVEPPSAFARMATPATESKPFSLQAPPKKAPSAKPKLGTGALTPTALTPTGPTTNFDAYNHGSVAGEQQYGAVPIPGAYEHASVAAAPGEQQYDAVPIPGAYADAANAQGHGAGHTDHYGAMR